MATFTCPDCGNMVSTAATACPKCGRPVTDEDRQSPTQVKPSEVSKEESQEKLKKKPKKKRSLLSKILIGLAIFFAIGLLAGGDKDGKDKTAEAPTAPAAPAAPAVTQKNVSISKEKLTAYIESYMDQVVSTMNDKFGRNGGGYTISWPQFAAENGTLYAIQVTFKKSLLEEHIQFASQAIAMIVLNGMKEQGMTLETMKHNNIMILSGAVCKRTGKTVSYGIAVIAPSTSDNVEWISRYEVN